MSSLAGNDLTTNIGNLPAVIGEVFNRIFPIQLNATGTDPNLTIVRDITLQDTASAPTRQINMSAGDDAVPGEHFGLDWDGGGQPFVMNTLDATDLQIRDTTLQLEDTLTPQTTDITATSISIVGGNSATWANIINNVGGGIPSLSQVLTVGQSAGNQNISDLNGLTYQGGTSLYNNLLAFVSAGGSITDLATINGVAYPPPVSADNLTAVLSAGNNASGLNIGGVGDIALSTINGAPYNTISNNNLNTTLSYGNNTSGFDIDFNNNSSILNVVNINGSPYPPYPVAPYGLTQTLTYSNNASGLSMTNINNIDLVTINGSSYPPPSSTQDLSTTLGYGNSAGSYSINMNLNDIQNCNNIDLVSINGVPFIPAKFSAVFPTFDVGALSNNSTNYGGTTVSIPVGNYQITYTIQLDGNITQGGGSYYMVRGYCFLYGNSSGFTNPYMVNSGLYPSQTISYNVGNGYYNSFTITDYISLPMTDTFQLGAYQSNEQGQTSYSCLISAVIQAV